MYTEHPCIDYQKYKMVLTKYALNDERSILLGEKIFIQTEKKMLLSVKRYPHGNARLILKLWILLWILLFVTRGFGFATRKNDLDTPEMKA